MSLLVRCRSNTCEARPPEAIIFRLAAPRWSEQKLVEGPPDVVAVASPRRSGPGVDIRLADQSVSRLAGELTAAEDYWLITNLSADASYVVDNPEGGGEYITVAPRRIAAPVPFEFRPRLAADARASRRVLVFAPHHA